MWELSFIDRMRQLEKEGLPFNEVLRATLPKLIGADTSHVLRTWVGRRARHNPEYFTRSISDMFGPSARNVLISLDILVNKQSLLEAKIPKEPPVQSLLVAMQRASTGIMVAQSNRSPTRP